MLRSICMKLMRFRTYVQFVGSLISILIMNVMFAAESADSAELAIGNYIGPKAIDSRPPKYPPAAQRRGGEGWVYVHMSIDETGKPYDLEVADSVGHRAFEGAALTALKRWKFDPARLDGVAVHSGTSRKVIFYMEAPSKGASPPFINRFDRVQELIKDGDKAKAYELISKMRPDTQNLYEYSWLGIAEFNYFKKWGSKAEQLRALEEAIAYESSSKFLPEELYLSAMLNKFMLEYELNYFRSALYTYEDLIALDTMDSNWNQQITKFVERIKEIQRDKTAFSLVDTVDANGYWSYSLLWNRFALKSEAGTVRHLRVRCDRRTIGLDYEEDLVYTIQGDPNACFVSFRGEPGDNVKIIQI